MMERDEIEAALAGARAAHAAGRWAEARAGFDLVRAASPLSADDLSALGDAAWWMGAIDESISASEAAFHLYVEGRSEPPRPGAAAMLAIDIGFSWLLRGDEALGSGWLGRAQRLLEAEPDCVERGYLECLEVDGALAGADFEKAIAIAQRVARFARDHGDETLAAYALVAEGIARLKSGATAEGLAVLDEAMLPVVAGRVRPTFAGNIYCQLMSVCHEVADLRRAQQWTDATARWCEGFGDAVMFVGVCRVHRAQLLQVRGEWQRAEAEIERVRSELADMNVVAIGLALYELGEIRRMRGDAEGARQAYEEAHAHGRDPLPGLALLWLRTGDARGALAALRTAEATTVDPVAKTRIWAAMVEAALAAGDLDAGRQAAEVLDAAASTYATSGLLAAAALAVGRVEAAAGNVEAAIRRLRDACRLWQQVDAPYLLAETRMVLASALVTAGDDHSATLERNAAAAAFARLGVVVADDGEHGRPGGLTRREAEVLSHVATGMTNREVADALFCSERTVARHLANVYVKLGVTTRTAAAAFAHANGIANGIATSSA